MKEDILEQIVDEYLKRKGYFTLANVKFRPVPGDQGYDSQQDSVPSDIDVIGFHPDKSGHEKVVAVSCKSWQDGFWIDWELDHITKNKKYAGRERWRTYRELANDKWAKAFKSKIRELTGQVEFHYWTACLFVGDPEHKEAWTENESFKRRLTRRIAIITLHDMLREIHDKLSTTPAGSDVGRLIQVMKAAKIKLAA